MRGTGPGGLLRARGRPAWSSTRSTRCRASPPTSMFPLLWAASPASTTPSSSSGWSSSRWSATPACAEPGVRAGLPHAGVRLETRRARSTMTAVGRRPVSPAPRPRPRRSRPMRGDHRVERLVVDRAPRGTNQSTPLTTLAAGERGRSPPGSPTPQRSTIAGSPQAAPSGLPVASRRSWSATRSGRCLDQRGAGVALAAGHLGRVDVHGAAAHAEKHQREQHDARHRQGDGRRRTCVESAVGVRCGRRGRSGCG